MATDDARTPGSHRAPRAGRRRAVATGVGVALLLGGGAAVAVGVTAQEPSPPAPASAQALPTSPAPSSGTPTPTTEASAPPAPTASPTAEAKAQPKPVKVTIPSLKVSSSLLELGLAEDGTIDVPKPGADYDKAAWFTGSPRPGAVGPAVIEGHVDGVHGPSVFYDLGKIDKGAKVHVERADGSTVIFVVDGVEAYPKDDFPVKKVYGNTSGPELRLITCGGKFDKATGHYVDNTVVYAHQA